MKITAINTCVLTLPTSRQMALEFPHHKMVVAEIATDEGIAGLGYSMVFSGAGAESVLVYLVAELMDWIPADLFEEIPACTEGHVRIPDRPGHGMVLQRGAVAKYRRESP